MARDADRFVIARGAVRSIEEPTAPDDILGQMVIHGHVRRILELHEIGAATGEHAHNWRMVFRQLPAPGRGYRCLLNRLVPPRGRQRGAQRANDTSWLRSEQRVWGCFLFRERVPSSCGRGPL
jgi:hypothetical protein